MKINDILFEGPQIGDRFELELGDLLIETVVEDVTEDGVVIKLDETGLKLVVDSYKQKMLVESKRRYGAEGEIDDDDNDIDDGEDRLSGRHGLSADPKKMAVYYPNDPERTKIRTQMNVPNLKKAIKSNLGKHKTPNLPEQSVAEATDKDGYHTSVSKGKFLPSKYGQDDDVNYLHDLMNSSGDGSGPQLVTINDRRVATELAAMYGGFVEKTGMGTYRIYQPRGAHQTAKTPELIHVAEDEMEEAKYQGREVPLGKPMKGDVKKSKVYVRGPKGNVVKVNFGDKNMRIKKSNPARRKSFRARHNCDNPGPRWKARYWSCKAW